jgi:hypothetical protein
MHIYVYVYIYITDPESIVFGAGVTQSSEQPHLVFSSSTRSAFAVESPWGVDRNVTFVGETFIFNRKPGRNIQIIPAFNIF